jgi:hypothetical protein
MCVALPVAVAVRGRGLGCVCVWGGGIRGSADLGAGRCMSSIGTLISQHIDQSAARGCVSARVSRQHVVQVTVTLRGMHQLLVKY